MLGPCSHWSRQPDWFARTLPLSPHSESFLLNFFCNSACPAGSQHPRGCPAGRWLPQIKICFSNFGISLNVQERELVFQRNHGPVALAKRCHTLEPALWLGQDLHRTAAVHRVTAFRQVPAPASACMVNDRSVDGIARLQIHTWERK